MTLGADWPTEELRDILDRYNLRVLKRERTQMGIVPWWIRARDRVRIQGNVSSQEGLLGFDPEASWTKTHYVLRRDVICEACGDRFGYNFEVVQVSRIHREGRATDGSLYSELGHQLGRRIRCPHCQTVQREPRRTLVRAERAQTGLACGLLLSGMLIFAGLGVVGGLLAGVWGFFVGLAVALASIVGLWYYALPHILNVGPVL